MAAEEEHEHQDDRDEHEYETKRRFHRGSELGVESAISLASHTL